MSFDTTTSLTAFTASSSLTVDSPLSVKIEMIPPTKPKNKADKSLKMANGQPSIEALTNTESKPVCGVLIRNETEAGFPAPFFFSDRATGITLHEHRGMGTPIKTDFTTANKPFPPK